MLLIVYNSFKDDKKTVECTLRIGGFFNYMVGEIKNYFNNPAISVITASREKIDILGKIGLAHNTNPQLTLINTLGEYRVDTQLNIGLATYIPNYTFIAALSKASEDQLFLQSMIARGHRIDKKRLEGKLFVTTDCAWKIITPNTPLYINKPQAHKDGAIAGVRDTISHLKANKGNSIINEATTIFFTKEDIIGALQFRLDTGTINPDIDFFPENVMKELFYQNRQVKAGGFGLFEAWNKGIVLRPYLVHLNVSEYRVDKTTMQFVRRLEKGTFASPERMAEWNTSIDGTLQDEALMYPWIHGFVDPTFTFH